MDEAARRHQRGHDRKRHGASHQAADAQAREGPLALQRTAGNAAVAGLIARLQTKLTVGASNDPLEREADEIARHVVGVLGSRREDALGVSTAPRPSLRRAAAAPAHTVAAGGEAGQGVEQSIDAARGKGEALPSATRQRLEPAFGADFGDVRVHTGSGARRLNEAVGAEAFTVGTDIFFRDEVPAANDTLLAHELTHVLQQRGGLDHAQRQVIRRRALGRPLDKITAYRGKRGEVADDGAAVEVPIGTELVVNDEPEQRRRGRSEDPEATPGYVQIRHSSGRGSADDEFRKLWVRVESLDLGPAPAKEVEGYDSRLDDTQQGLKLYGGYKGFATKGVYDDVEASDTTRSNMSYASDAGDIAAYVVGLAAALRKWDTKHLDGWEHFENVLNVIDSTGKGAKGVAGMIKTGTNGQKGDPSSDIHGGLAMFTDIFNGIKETYKAIRKVVELAVSAGDAKKAKTGQDVTKDIFSIIINLLETAKSGVTAAKTFIDTFTNDPASQALKDSIPGLGIAIGAADLIVRSVDLVSGIVHASRMRDAKQEFKAQLGGQKGTSSKAEAEAIIQRLEAKQQAGEELTDAEQAQLAAANDYLLSKGLEWINDKRRNRALLKMSVALTKISGDVATLGGASAPVGAGLKAGALALDVGFTVFRKFKMWGRDKKERREEKGEDVGFFGMFDSEKSSKKKLRGYHKTVDKIFDMIIKAGEIEGLKALTVYTKIETYVEAIGMTLKKLFALRDEPAKLRNEMIAALKKRE